MKCPGCNTDLPQDVLELGCPVCKSLGLEVSEDEPSNEVKTDAGLVENLARGWLSERQSGGDNKLLAELRKQTDQLTAIKTILLWVLVIIPLSLTVIGIILGAMRHGR